MNHDSLCPNSAGCMCEPHPDGCASCNCDCEFIANVRADEREKAAQRVESCVNKFKARDFNDAVDACAAAVRGES